MTTPFHVLSGNLTSNGSCRVCFLPDPFSKLFATATHLVSQPGMHRSHFTFDVRIAPNIVCFQVKVMFLNSNHCQCSFDEQETFQVL